MAKDNELPSFSDISPTNGLDLDEKSAARYFCGKTKLEAIKLFSSNPIKYQECLMFMGENAFRFYFCTVVDHFSMVDDADDIVWLLALLTHRLEFSPSSFERIEHDVVFVLEKAKVILGPQDRSGRSEFVDKLKQTFKGRITESD